jgi:hypothetical protein
VWIEREIGCAEADRDVEGDVDHSRGIDARY